MRDALLVFGPALLTLGQLPKGPMGHQEPAADGSTNLVRHGDSVDTRKSEKWGLGAPGALAWSLRDQRTRPARPRAGASALGARGSCACRPPESSDSNSLHFSPS